MGRNVNNRLNLWRAKRFVKPEERVFSHQLSPGTFVKVKFRKQRSKLESKFLSLMKIVKRVGHNSYVLDDGKKYHSNWLVPLPSISEYDTVQPNENEAQLQAQVNSPLEIRRSNRSNFGQPPCQFSDQKMYSFFIKRMIKYA